MFSPKKKSISSSSENNKIPPLSLENDILNHLKKDFKIQVSQNDFLKLNDETSRNLGFLDEVIPLLYKNNKSVYYVKVINKKNIINISYKNILNTIYKLNNDKQTNKNNNIFDYMINLQTHWEDGENLYLVFDGIKKYTSLETLLKNNSEYIKEENIYIIFRQILEIVNILHENNIYGCNLFINSFIYDKYTQTLKLTDLGFSKIFKSSTNTNDNILENGFEFNEYTPPEFIQKMNDFSKVYEPEFLKDQFYDIWQLGILFYKIASFGESPYDDAKNENLKEYIMNKKIDYSKLDKYSLTIIQIIDKMLQFIPKNRYKIKQILCLDPFRSINKIPLVIINKKVEEKPVTMNMINKEKSKNKDAKIDMASLLDDMEIKRKATQIIRNGLTLNKEKEEEEKNMNKNNNINDINKNILNKIKIQGNLVKDKNTMVSQEIYPNGSVLPIFKSKFLNRFNIIDKNLVLDLSNKLNLLEKEYKKLDENKIAVLNITNYVNNNLKDLMFIDNDNIELLIKKFSNLKISNIETNDLYEEMVRNKGEYAQDKFKALISNLIYEIKILEIELEKERSTVEKLRKNLQEQEKRNMDLKEEYQEKVEFYEKKIELLEEVIFNSDNKAINSPEDLKKNNQLIYQALSNSIKDFTDINIKLKSGLEENLKRYQENKKFWLDDMIKAKDNFRNEMKFFLEKSIEPPKIYNFEKKNIKEISNQMKNEERIEELKRKIKELFDLTNEQKMLINKNTDLINELKKDIKSKEEKNEELLRLINNKS